MRRLRRGRVLADHRRARRTGARRGARRAGRGERPQGRTEPDLPALRSAARHHGHQPGGGHARRAVGRGPDRGAAGGPRGVAFGGVVAGAGAGHRPVDGLPDDRRGAGAQELGDLLAAGRGQAGGRAAALVQRGLPPFHHPSEQHRQPRRAPLRRGARRGAGVRARSSGAGGARPALGEGGRAGGRHRRVVRAHPESGRPDGAAGDDPARPGRGPRRPGDLRGRGERDAGDRVVQVPCLPGRPRRRGGHGARQGRPGGAGRAAAHDAGRRVDARAAAGPRVADRGPPPGPALRAAHDGRGDRRVRRYGRGGHAGGHRRGGGRSGAGRARSARDARPRPGRHGRSGARAVLGRRLRARGPARAAGPAGARGPVRDGRGAGGGRPRAHPRRRRQPRCRRLATGRRGRHGAQGRPGADARTP